MVRMLPICFPQTNKGLAVSRYFIGRRDRNRTCDPLIKRLSALYSNSVRKAACSLSFRGASLGNCRQVPEISLYFPYITGKIAETGSLKTAPSAKTAPLWGCIDIGEGGSVNGPKFDDKVRLRVSEGGTQARGGRGPSQSHSLRHFRSGSLCYAAFRSNPPEWVQAFS